MPTVKVNLHFEWLKRYLNEYENAFILISHDIPFLNSVINLIYHMENQEFNRYVGDYDKFMEVYEMKKSQLEAAYKRQQQEISELKDFVARNKARVATRNMAMSRQKKLDNMELIELAAEKPKPEFNFIKGRTSGKILFNTKDLVIGYFEQEMAPGNTNTCIEEIWEEFPGLNQFEVRAALAKCGLTTKHIESQVRVLSGGEQAKVRLCKLINRETNLLLLDEPTNHLDQDAKTELKRALKEYKGSILIICHEPEFYKEIVDQVWDCSQWTTKIL